MGGYRCIHRGCSEAKLILLHLKTCPAVGPRMECPKRYHGCHQTRKLLAHYDRCCEIRAEQKLVGGPITHEQQQKQQQQQHVCLVCSLMARHARNVLLKAPLPTTEKKNKKIISSLKLNHNGISQRAFRNTNIIKRGHKTDSSQNTMMPPPPSRCAVSIPSNSTTTASCNDDELIQQQQQRPRSHSVSVVASGTRRTLLQNSSSLPNSLGEDGNDLLSAEEVIPISSKHSSTERNPNSFIQQRQRSSSCGVLDGGETCRTGIETIDEEESSSHAHGEENSLANQNVGLFY